MKRAVIFAAVLSSACASSDPHCPTLPEGGRYCLQPLAAIAPFGTQQKVDIRFKDRSETMLVAIETDEKALNFVGLSPFGQKLLQLRCTDTASEMPLSPSSRLDPALLCGLLQWTLWPAESVQRGLQAPLRLAENAERRNIYRDQQLIFSALRTGSRPPFSRIELRLPMWDMTLDIDSLPAAGSAP